MRADHLVVPGSGDAHRGRAGVLSASQCRRLHALAVIFGSQLSPEPNFSPIGICNLPFLSLHSTTTLWDAVADATWAGPRLTLPVHLSTVPPSRCMLSLHVFLFQRRARHFGYPQALSHRETTAASLLQPFSCLGRLTTVLAPLTNVFHDSQDRQASRFLGSQEISWARTPDVIRSDLQAQPGHRH